MDLEEQEDKTIWFRTQLAFSVGLTVAFLLWGRWIVDLRLHTPVDAVLYFCVVGPLGFFTYALFLTPPPLRSLFMASVGFVLSVLWPHLRKDERQILFVLFAMNYVFGSVLAWPLFWPSLD